jgi:hypothetical protein
MAKVNVFYSEDCQLCPPYLDDLNRLSNEFNHQCETLSLQGNPLAVAAVLQHLRETGHTISSLPFFVVSKGEQKYSYEGILSSYVMAEVLEKFI